MSAPTTSRPPQSDEVFEREWPHDVDAERIALGAMLMPDKTAAAAVADVAALLRQDSYYRPAHGLIHETIMRLWEAGKPFDAVAVGAELTSAGDAGRMGGLDYLHTLIRCVPAAVMAGHYARIVQEKALLRKVAEICTTGLQQALSPGADGAELAARLEAQLAEATAGLTVGQLEPVVDYWAEVLDGIERPLPEGERVRTGVADMDALTGGGLRAPQLVVVAGRPSSGKSTLGLDFARANGIDRQYRDAEDVLLCTLEMSRDEVMWRAISAEARVGLHSITSSTVSSEDWDRILKVQPQVRDSKLWIDDSPVCGIREIRARYMELARRGHRPKAIIIDQLELMTHPGDFGGNRQQQVQSLIRGLKLLAKQLNVAIVVMVQVNRGPEQRSDKRPMLSDLRESGAIEANADIVIFVHREDMYEREGPRAGEADFIVAKHRNGPTATVTVAFQGHYARFVDMAPVIEEKPSQAAQAARGAQIEAPGYIQNSAG